MDIGESSASGLTGALIFNLGDHDVEKLKSLQVLLHHATAIEKLSLTLIHNIQENVPIAGHSFYHQNDGENVRSMFGRLASCSERGLKNDPRVQLMWSGKLECLQLAEMICTSNEPTEVVRRCSTTLRCLYLTDVLLVPWSQEGERPHQLPRECLVRLFYNIRSILQLDTVSLRGFF